MKYKLLWILGFVLFISNNFSVGILKSHACLSPNNILCEYVLNKKHLNACALNILKKLAEYQDEKVQMFAKEALRDTSNETAYDTLKKLLKKGTNSEKCISYALLNIKGNDAIDFLRALLKEKASICVSAIEILARIKDDRAGLYIRPLLSSRFKKLRYSAAHALGRLQDKDSVPTLKTLLQDENSDVRLAALWALAQIGDKSAVESMKPLVADPDEMVRTILVVSLAKIGGESAIKALLQMQNDKSTLVANQVKESLEQNTETNPRLGKTQVKKTLSTQS